MFLQDRPLSSSGVCVVNLYAVCMYVCGVCLQMLHVQVYYVNRRVERMVCYLYVYAFVYSMCVHYVFV